MQKLPSVTAACLTETVPMAVNGNPSVSFSTGLGSPRAIHSAHRFTVGKDYFDTLGVPILLGRGFRKEDEAAGSTAVIVTEKLVRVFWQPSAAAKSVSALPWAQRAAMSCGW